MLLENDVTTILPDGRFSHVIHQSFLDTFLVCPERARRQAYEITPRTETDSTALGTALHRTIEETINLAIDEIWIAPSAVVDLFQDRWTEIQEQLDIRWVKRQVKGATSYGIRMATTFAMQVLPELDPYATEIKFDELVLIDEPHRLVTVSGTMDYIDHKWGLCDWKSASRPYIPWEKERWGSQSLIYTWALREIDVLGFPFSTDTFRYVVFPSPGNTVQYVDVTRGPEWDDWLRDQIRSVCYTLETDLPEWPKNDQHALCSEKWCDAWATCKGASLGGSGCVSELITGKPLLSITPYPSEHTNGET